MNEGNPAPAVLVTGGEETEVLTALKLLEINRRGRFSLLGIKGILTDETHRASRCVYDSGWSWG